MIYFIFLLHSFVFVFTVFNHHNIEVNLINKQERKKKKPNNEKMKQKRNSERIVCFLFVENSLSKPSTSCKARRTSPETE